MENHGKHNMKDKPNNDPNEKAKQPDELLFRDVFRQEWLDRIEAQNVPRGLILIDESIIDVFTETRLWPAITSWPEGRNKWEIALLKAFNLWRFAKTKDNPGARPYSAQHAADILNVPFELNECARQAQPGEPLLIVAKMAHTPAFPAIARLFTDVWIVARNFPEDYRTAPRSATCCRILPDVRTGLVWIDTPDNIDP